MPPERTKELLRKSQAAGDFLWGWSVWLCRKSNAAAALPTIRRTLPRAQRALDSRVVEASVHQAEAAASAEASAEEAAAKVVDTVTDEEAAAAEVVATVAAAAAGGTAPNSKK